MKHAYIVLAALMCTSPVLADTSKVFGNANAKVLRIEQNKNVRGKGLLPPIGNLGPLMPYAGTALPAMPMGPLMPMINGGFMSRL